MPLSTLPFKKQTNILDDSTALMISKIENLPSLIAAARRDQGALVKDMETLSADEHLPNKFPMVLLHDTWTKLTATISDLFDTVESSCAAVSASLHNYPPGTLSSTDAAIIDAFIFAWPSSSEPPQSPPGAPLLPSILNLKLLPVMEKLGTLPSVTVSRVEGEEANQASKNKTRLSSASTVSEVVILSRQNSFPISICEVDEHPYMSVLTTFPLFATFPRDVMELISLSAFEMRRKKGQIIIRKGEEGAEIFFLVKGSVSVVVDRKEVTVLHPTTFFGEMGVLFLFKRTATVIAKTSDCELVVVTKQKMQDIVSSNKKVRDQVAAFTESKEVWWKRQQYVLSQEKFGAEFANDIARNNIKKLDMFASATDTLVDQLAMTMKCHVFNQGQDIITIRDDSHAIFLILSGSVQVVGPTGIVHAEMTAGSFFGEVGVFLKMKRTASIRAKEESHIFELASEELEKILTYYPAIKTKIEAAVNERYGLYKKRSDQENVSSTDAHIPDQFDMEIGSQSLSKLSIFQGVDKTVVSELAMKMTRKMWESGALIIECNAIGESMFFLAAGDAEVIAESGEVIDKVSGPSAYFGEVAIIEQVPRTATVKCTTTCSTYELRKDDFKSVVAQYPSIAEQIQKTCEDRVQRVSHNLSGKSLHFTFVIQFLERTE
ncbi:cyclic nucleotide-binding-like protein [Chytriomyces sp. MP71]|nr:cyclic nucleotide-binding-like protein [Chytriomyces sp. MP71]